MLKVLCSRVLRMGLKDFRDNAEQQHIAAQQKAALQVKHTHTHTQGHVCSSLCLINTHVCLLLQHAHAHSSGFFITQDSSFGNLILPVLPRLEPES